MIWTILGAAVAVIISAVTGWWFGQRGKVAVITEDLTRPPVVLSDTITTDIEVENEEIEIAERLDSVDDIIADIKSLGSEP